MTVKSPFSLQDDILSFQGMPIPKKKDEESSGAAKAKKPQTRGERMRNKNASELVAIREQLGMSQAEFSISLGESRDRIVNIENGRVKVIPPELLDHARSLLESEQATRVGPLESLQSKTMNELIDDWWRQIDAKDDKEGALMLGVSGMTVIRWRGGQIRPKPNDLLYLQKKVERLARLAQKT